MIINNLKRIYHYTKNEVNKYRIGKMKVNFSLKVQIDSNCRFEGYNSVGEGNILNNCVFGTGSYTGKNVSFSSVKIGKFCSIGSNIRNTTGRHPTNGFISTHPAFFSVGKAAGFTFCQHQKFKELHFVEDNYLVVIGNDVWIGDNVTILDGVSIGDGAIIGLGAVVTTNIEPYSINVGIPARPIKYRFEKKTIEFLLRIRWWEKDFEWIRKNSNSFGNVDQFDKIIL